MKLGLEVMCLWWQTMGVKRLGRANISSSAPTIVLEIGPPGLPTDTVYHWVSAIQSFDPEGVSLPQDFEYSWKVVAGECRLDDLPTPSTNVYPNTYPNKVSVETSCNVEATVSNGDNVSTKVIDVVFHPPAMSSAVNAIGELTDQPPNVVLEVGPPNEPSDTTYHWVNAASSYDPNGIGRPEDFEYSWELVTGSCELLAGVNTPSCSVTPGVSTVQNDISCTVRCSVTYKGMTSTKEVDVTFHPSATRIAKDTPHTLMTTQAPITHTTPMATQAPIKQTTPMATQAPITATTLPKRPTSGSTAASVHIGNAIASPGGGYGGNKGSLSGKANGAISNLALGLSLVAGFTMCLY